MIIIIIIIILNVQFSDISVLLFWFRKVSLGSSLANPDQHPPRPSLISVLSLILADKALPLYLSIMCPVSLSRCQPVPTCQSLQ